MNDAAEGGPPPAGARHSVATGGPTAGSREGLLNEAVQVHQRGDAAAAEQLYQGLLAAYPEDPDALHYLGLLRVQQRRLEQGEALIRRSIAAQPGNAHAWNNLGNLLYSRERHADAVDAYLGAVVLDPELKAPWRNLGWCIEHSDSPERAIAVVQRVLEQVPDLMPAYHELGHMLRLVGRHAEAVEVYRRWLELDPGSEIARHMLAAGTREGVPERASDAYVRELFDDFADVFDEQLKRIGYQAPQLVARALGEELGVDAGLRDILDAGCGTGLSGVDLRPLAARLTGIDLSPEMLRRAEARGCYDALAEAELTAFMAARPAAFDVVVCVDTLCYFGSLDAPFRAAHTTLRPGGLLAFSVEELAATSAASGCQIEHHGRYLHGQPYVEQALAAAGFQVANCRRAVLRQEVLKDVSGLVVVAARMPEVG